MGRELRPSYRDLISGPAHSRDLLDSSSSWAAERWLARRGGGRAQTLGLPIGLAVGGSHLHLVSGEGRTQGRQEVTTHHRAGIGGIFNHTARHAQWQGDGEGIHAYRSGRKGGFEVCPTPKDRLWEGESGYVLGKGQGARSTANQEGGQSPAHPSEKEIPHCTKMKDTGRKP